MTDDTLKELNKAFKKVYSKNISNLIPKNIYLIDAAAKLLKEEEQRQRDAQFEKDLEDL